MKSLSLAAGFAVFAIPLAAAQGASIAIGNPLAAECYEAALARDDSATSMRTCSRALEDEAISRGDRVATFVNRGILHMLRGNNAAAEADYNAALALDPSAPDPLLNKAILLLRQERGAEALPLVEKAIEGNARREALAYYTRAIAHEQAGNFRAAYADPIRARDLEPGWDLPGQELARYQVRR